MTFVSLSVACQRSLSRSLLDIEDAVLIIILGEKHRLRIVWRSMYDLFYICDVTDTLFAFLVGCVDVALHELTYGFQPNC